MSTWSCGSASAPSSRRHGDPDVVERIDALIVNSGGRAGPAVELALAVGDLPRLVERVGLGASAMRDTLVEDSQPRKAA